MPSWLRKKASNRSGAAPSGRAPAPEDLGATGSSLASWYAGNGGIAKDLMASMMASHDSALNTWSRGGNVRRGDLPEPSRHPFNPLPRPLSTCGLPRPLVSVDSGSQAALLSASRRLSHVVMAHTNVPLSWTEILVMARRRSSAQRPRLQAKSYCHGGGNYCPRPSTTSSGLSAVKKL
eukprot:scaffold1318_cov388-Prasinococcus_capsulatus_cf.AAC.28